MNFLKKVQNLPLTQRKIIFWAIIIIFGLGFLTLWIIMTRERLQNIKIGEFVENINYDGWQCVSFNKECNMLWKNITGVVSHPIKDKYLYKITTQTGRNCIVTGNHSLFKFYDKIKICHSSIMC